jgi:hypothetical protein
MEISDFGCRPHCSSGKSRPSTANARSLDDMDGSSTAAIGRARTLTGGYVKRVAAVGR